MSTEGREQWIVGLDLSARSRGAEVFAAWIERAPSPGSRPEIVGVHVLETWSARYLPMSREEYVHAVRSIADSRAREVGEVFARVEVVEAERAEDGLAHAAGRAAGLVIGRSAGMGSRPVVRLGRVARRLLRRLPTTVYVVPPDLPASALTRGPVVLATDLGPSSRAALTTALALARGQARPLVLAHVGELRHSDLLDELEPRWLAARERHRQEVATAFAAWAEAHGVQGLRRVLEFGAAPESLAALAVREQACLVVVGSRRLGALERVFSTSTASALAGLCDVPVAVVPPPDGA